MTSSRFRLTFTSSLTVSLIALVLGAAIAAPSLRAASPQKDEVAKTGKARLVAPLLPGRDGEVRIPVTIDITDVQIDGRLAVLGAYVVAFSFDKAKVAFVGVARGESPEFEELPSATPVAKANAMGIVKVVSDQSQESAPTGAVSVAVLTFHELVPGGTSTIKPRIDSIASSLRKDREGRFITDLKIPVEVTPQ